MWAEDITTQFVGSTVGPVQCMAVMYELMVTYSVTELGCNVVFFYRQVIDGNSPWPTYNIDFSDNCGSENKVCKDHPTLPIDVFNIWR